MKSENRKPKIENRIRRVPTCNAEGSALERREKPRAGFDLWFSNWVIHRD